MITQQSVEINHDPFTRVTLMRDTVLVPDRRSCEFCGRRAKFRYWGQRDDYAGRPTILDEYRYFQYCSVGCFRIYCDLR